MENFTKEEIRVFRKLSTPAKIQDFLNSVPANFALRGETCFSPRLVLKMRRAHCLEGALLAAAALRFHGRPPLVVDLLAARHDRDHVIAVFKQGGFWGAISKSNHATLRFRDPVYKSIRELVMSYFNEYFDEKGRKNLRMYSLPVDLSRFDKKKWMTFEKSVWFISRYLNKIRHNKILNEKQLRALRGADVIERKTLKFTEWKRR